MLTFNSIRTSHNTDVTVLYFAPNNHYENTVVPLLSLSWQISKTGHREAVLLVQSTTPTSISIQPVLTGQSSTENASESTSAMTSPLSIDFKNGDNDDQGLPKFPPLHRPPPVPIRKYQHPMVRKEMKRNPTSANLSNEPQAQTQI